MPISIKHSAEKHPSMDPIAPEALPVELFFMVRFDDPATAAKWCADVMKDFGSLDLSLVEKEPHRIVIWGPPLPQSGFTTAGCGDVFVSELCLRCVRSRGSQRVPGAQAVSLSELPYDLHFYAGSPVDKKAYTAIKT